MSSTSQNLESQTIRSLLLIECKHRTMWTNHQPNSVVHTSTKAELANYYHQCLGSPPKSTILQILQNHAEEFQSLPRFTRDLMKYLPPSTATAKGHMVRVRKGLRSIKNNRDVVVKIRHISECLHPLSKSYVSYLSFLVSATKRER